MPLLAPSLAILNKKTGALSAAASVPTKFAVVCVLTYVFVDIIIVVGFVANMIV